MQTKQQLEISKFCKILEQFASCNQYRYTDDVHFTSGVSDSYLGSNTSSLASMYLPQQELHIGEVIKLQGADFIQATLKLFGNRAPNQVDLDYLALGMQPWKKLDYLFTLEQQGKKKGNRKQRVRGAYLARRLWKLHRASTDAKHKRLAKWTNSVFRRYCRRLDRSLLLESSSRRFMLAGFAYKEQQNSASLPSERKKIVIANFYPIWPPLHGGQRRIFFLARELAKTFDVEIVTPWHGGETVTSHFGPHFREIRVVVEAEYRQAQSTIDKIVSMAGDLAYSLHWSHCNAYQKVLADRLKLAEVGITAHPYSIYALLSACGSRKLPLVFDSQNAEVLGKASVLERHPDYLASVKAVELAALNETQLTLACSQSDIQTYANEYGADASRIVMVENGVDAVGVPPITEATRQRCRDELELGARKVAIFAGSFHFPNFRAADLVIAAAAKVPNVLFVFLGSICRYEKLANLSMPNVVSLGEVDESFKWMVFSIGDIGLNPMELGSGSNIKVLEYAAAGLSVVSTPFGTRGIDKRLVKTFLVAEPDSFAECLSKIANVSDDILKEKGASARLLAQKYADWSRIGSIYTASLQSLIERHDYRALKKSVVDLKMATETDASNNGNKHKPPTN